MKITSIKQQIKSPGRYSVFVDDSYLFSLSESQLVEASLYSGQELTPDQVAEFKRLSSNGKMFDRVLNYLSYRQRSKWEIKDYLRRKDANEDQASFVLEKCERLGLIDDEKFARAWVQSRRLGKPMSQRKIRSELSAKRIASGIIDNVLLEDRDETDELQVLKLLVDKKRSRYPDKQKLMQYLARQGFGYDDIKRAVSDDDES